MEFERLPQFERDFASFLEGLLAAFVVAASVPLAATPFLFAATTCGHHRCGRGPVRESGSLQSSWAAMPAATLAASFVLGAVRYMESLLWSAGQLVGHAADLLCSGHLYVFNLFSVVLVSS